MTAFCSAVNFRRFLFLLMNDSFWLLNIEPAGVTFQLKHHNCIKTKASGAHLRTYLTGQLGSLERKSVEPIALDAGVPPRTLQQFLSAHRWDEGAVGRRLRTWVTRKHGYRNAIGLVDETSFAKKGTKTAGVHRQYCGTTGKTDNCVVTVHLGYVTPDFHALLDGDLYLPASWIEDPVRRARSSGERASTCAAPSAGRNGSRDVAL